VTSFRGVQISEFQPVAFDDSFEIRIRRKLFDGCVWRRPSQCQ
jgi:hypothetical protein